MADGKILGQTTTPGNFPQWDFVTEGGIIPIIEGVAEVRQRASVCAFLTKGTVPQLPDAGVPWLEFLTDNSTFADVDQKIRYNLNQAGLQYTPIYEPVNGSVQCKVVPR